MDVQEKKHSPIRRVVVLVILLGGIVGGGYALYAARTERSARPWPRTLTFAPDGKWLAYIWQDAVYRYPCELGARPHTLTDSLQVRWFPVGKPELEQSALLDTIDLRPDGRVYYRLDGAVRFSPDSKRLAAVGPNGAIVIDLQTNSRIVHGFAGDRCGDLRWVSPDEIAYTTFTEDRFAVWRQTLNELPEQRRKVYECPHNWILDSGCGPMLRNHHWSPDGRYLVVTKDQPDDEAWALLDVVTGSLIPLGSSVTDVNWRSDSSLALVYGSEGYKTEPQALLVNPATGEVKDLMARFVETFGKEMKLTFVSERWTPDNRYIILYNTKQIPSKSPDRPPTDVCTGYVLQPDPWKVVLSNERFIRWSPVPGWVLLQGSGEFDWLNYAGTETVHLRGWPNDWEWSPDGTLAAQVERGKVMLLRPQLPPGSPARELGTEAGATTSASAQRPVRSVARPYSWERGSTE